MIAQEYYLLESFYLDDLIQRINAETLCLNGRLFQIMEKNCVRPTGNPQLQYVAVMVRGKGKE